MTATDDPSQPKIADELASALGWWRDAGVDCDFTDDATAWFNEADDAGAATADPAHRADGQQSGTPAAQQPIEAPNKELVQRVDFMGDTPPASLEEFRKFWLEAPGLDAIGPRGRVAPRGSPGAELMVLVVDPEQGDRDTLLSGPQGQLLERICAAMGISNEAVYVASALPRHTPMADTHGLAASGMDKVLHHHIKLAAPRRIIAFGASLTPFIAEDADNGEKSLREINPVSSFPPTLVSEGLDSLMEMPRLKARFWRRWIEWSANQT